MKLRAWHISKMKKILRLYEPSKEYLEKSLIEMIELCEKVKPKVLRIILLTCYTCGKEFEKPLFDYTRPIRNKIGGEKPKVFCSKECSNKNSMIKLKQVWEEQDKYFDMKEESKKYYERRKE